MFWASERLVPGGSNASEHVPGVVSTRSEQIEDRPDTAMQCFAYMFPICFIFVPLQRWCSVSAKLLDSLQCVLCPAVSHWGKSSGSPFATDVARASKRICAQARHEFTTQAYRRAFREMGTSWSGHPKRPVQSWSKQTFVWVYNFFLRTKFDAEFQTDRTLQGWENLSTVCRAGWILLKKRYGRFCSLNESVHRMEFIFNWFWGKTSLVFPFPSGAWSPFGQTTIPARDHKQCKNNMQWSEINSRRSQIGKNLAVSDLFLLCFWPVPDLFLTRFWPVTAPFLSCFCFWPVSDLFLTCFLDWFYY